tara:strand:- start:1140 stop:1790 length:651 start_codon:yes stop_codon:yes gene_type:complete
MNSNRSVKIGKKQQLFDLNGDLTNFDLNFTAKSLQNKDFHVLVVDQTTLDSNTNLDFKRTQNGYMAGNIINDKNVYQNYFLCLKSDFDDHEVVINIDKKEIAPVTENNTPPNTEITKEKYDNPPSNSNSNKLNIKTSFFNWKIILILILTLAAGGYLWYNYNKRKKSSVSEAVTKSSPSPSPAMNISSAFSSPASSQSSDIALDSSIMDKINKLKV